YRRRDQRAVHDDARPDRRIPRAGRTQDRISRRAADLRGRDRRARRDAPGGAADGAHRDGPAALRDPARVPARRRRAPPRHRPVRRGPMRVAVIGTGLMGTSVALALREHGISVWLADTDPEAARLAANLGAGVPLPDPGPGTGPEIDRADVAVIAVPPSAVAATLAAAQARGLASCYTDVASVKQLPVSQARALGCDMTSYVPGHPLAGREKHGPAAARADLFLGRTWALCPAAETSAAAHDRWVALVSHAPHLVAAAMAARLEAAPTEALDLAGQGLRDVTRIAAGDTGLWTQILAANAEPVAEVLAAVAADLAEAARMLTEGDPKSVATLLDIGQAGVARIPGKHGGAPREFTAVQVVIRDQPGELTRLFDAAGRAGVNIEDVRIEHSPGLPVGVAELSVRPAEAGPLLAALETGGWPVRR